jgi:hypothetical protein
MMSVYRLFRRKFTPNKSCDHHVPFAVHGKAILFILYVITIIAIVILLCWKVAYLEIILLK